MLIFLTEVLKIALAITVADLFSRLIKRVFKRKIEPTQADFDKLERQLNDEIYRHPEPPVRLDPFPPCSPNKGGLSSKPSSPHPGPPSGQGKPKRNNNRKKS